MIFLTEENANQNSSAALNTLEGILLEVFKGRAIRREYQFSTRKFKFDYALLSSKIAFEFEGGSFGNYKKCRCGARIRVSGFHGSTRLHTDCHKYNLAACSGWVVFRFTAKNIENIPEMERIFTEILELDKLRKKNEG